MCWQSKLCSAVGVVLVILLNVFGIPSLACALPAEGKTAVTQQNSPSGPQTKITIGIVPGSEANVFTVENPARIVADITKTRVKKNETISVKNSTAVSQIRMGSHPDKARIVIDLLGSSLPVYTWRTMEGALIIVINNPNVGAAPAQEKPSPAPIATKTSVPSVKLPSLTNTPTTPLRTLGDLAAAHTPQVTPIVIGDENKVTEPTPVPTPAAVETKTHISLEVTARASPSMQATLAAENTTPPMATKTETALEVSPIASEVPTAHATKVTTPIAPAAIETSTPTIAPTIEATAHESAQKSATPLPPTPTAVSTQSAAPTVMTPSPLSAPFPTPLPTLPASARIVEAPAGSARTWVLREFNFDYLQPGKIPLLKLILSRTKAQVQTVKVDPKTYKLSISDCSLSGQHLTLPQFPPADFTGFSLLTAKQENGVCEVTIVVEAGVTIGTFVRNSEIWIKRL